jgi:predicted dienelactone hydrolase
MPITSVYPTDSSGPHTFGQFGLDVALDAEPSRGNGRLIVFSLGAGGDAYTLHTPARTPAPAGFLVAQPEHRGENRHDESDSAIAQCKRRPAEISQAIDAVDANSKFSSALQPDRLGVYGVSAAS